jgi:hypothetical protein
MFDKSLELNRICFYEDYNDTLDFGADRDESWDILKLTRSLRISE